MILVIGKHAYELGLLPYDSSNLIGWCCDELVSMMRGIVKEEYSDLSLAR